MRGRQVHWTWLLVAALAGTAAAAGRRSLLEDATSDTFDLPLPFSDNPLESSILEQPATADLEETTAATGSALKGKDKKEGKKLDVHLEVEKPDVKGKLKEAKTEVKEKAAAAKAEVEKKLAEVKDKLPKKEKKEDKKGDKKEKVDPLALKDELAHQIDPMSAQQEPLMATDPSQSIAPSAQQLTDSLSEMARHASDSLGDLKKGLDAHLGVIDKKIAGDLKDKIKAGSEKAKEKLDEKEAQINCEKFGKGCPPTPPPEPESPPPPVPSPPPPSPSPPPPVPVFPPPPPSKKMKEKMDKLAKLELLADEKLAAFGPAAEDLVDTLHKVKDDARKQREVALDTARNYTIGLAQLTAQQAIDTQRALADTASRTTQTLTATRQQIARDSQTVREGLAAGAQPSDESITLPGPDEISALPDPAGASAVAAVIPGADSALSSAGSALAAGLPATVGLPGYDGQAALAVAADAASQGLPPGALPSADAIVTGALVGSAAGLTSADMSMALINAQSALSNVQTALRTDLGSLRNMGTAAQAAAPALPQGLPQVPQGLPVITGSATASATMPSVTEIIQSQQSAAQGAAQAAQGLLPNVTAMVNPSIANANPMAAAAVQGVGQTLQNAGAEATIALQNAQVPQTNAAGALPQGLDTGIAAQGAALVQTIQNAQQALQNAQATLASNVAAIGAQPGLNMAGAQPAQLLTSQLNGIGAQVANAVQGMQTQIPLTAGVNAGITPGMNSVTSSIGGYVPGVDLPTASASVTIPAWDTTSTVVYSNNAPTAAPGPNSAPEGGACCDAPEDGTCNAFMQTFHIRLAPAADRWAQEYFCARDSNNKGRLTPVSTAFASCLSLTSPDTRECVSDAECQLPAPLGHGPGYFCAEMPCCANVNTLLAQLPDGAAGNTTIRAQTASNGPRKICRPDAAAFGNAGVCSARTTDATIDTPSGMSVSYTAPASAEPLFNATVLAAQAGLAALPRVYASLDLAAQDFAAAMDPEGYAMLRNVLADQAQTAVASMLDISSILKLRSQLDSAIVDYAYSLAGQQPKALVAAAAPETAPEGAMAPMGASLPMGAPYPDVLTPVYKGVTSPAAQAPAPVTDAPAAAPKKVKKKSHKPSSAPAPAKDNLALGPDGDFTMTQMMAGTKTEASAPAVAVAGAPTISARAPSSTPSTTVLASNYVGQSPPDLYAALGPPAPTEGTIPGIVHRALPGTVDWVNTTSTVATTLLQPAQNFVNGTAVNSAIQATADTIIDNTVGNGPYRVGPLDGAAIFGTGETAVTTPNVPLTDARGVPWNPPPISYLPPPTPTVGTVTPQQIAAERAPPAPAGSALEAILQALGPQQTLGRLAPTTQVVNNTATALLG